MEFAIWQVTFIEVLGFDQHCTAPTCHSQDSCPSFSVCFLSPKHSNSISSVILDLLLKVISTKRCSFFRLLSKLCLNRIWDFICGSFQLNPQTPFGNTPLVADSRLASIESLLPTLLSAAPPARGWQDGDNSGMCHLSRHVNVTSHLPLRLKY